jgi:hypothetical protein
VCKNAGGERIEQWIAGVWAVIPLLCSAVDVDFFSGVSRLVAAAIAQLQYKCTRQFDLRPGHRSRLPAFFVAC